MTLYRKHRPQTIQELDQLAVRNYFMKASSAIDSLPHAFLFSGPKGTGKTSSARILAKLVNCTNLKKKKTSDTTYFEPCNECESCTSIASGSSMDIIEIDAASNRGIDDIRALRETVGLAAHGSRKKLYIIDEAHMLTHDAANAFLKTLEEPPSHVIFVLATTDPQKLPTTVVSRLKILSFKKANKSEIIRSLQRVSEKENIDIEKNALEEIVKISDGSFRDALKVLEDLVGETKKITAKDINELDSFFMNDFEYIRDALFSKNTKRALTLVHQCNENGGGIRELVDYLILQARNALLTHYRVLEDEDFDLESQDLITLIELLMEARNKLTWSPEPVVSLEIAIVKFAPINEKHGKNKSKKKEQKKTLDTSDTVINARLDDTNWGKLLSQLREKNASIEALLRASKPLSLSGNTLNLGVYYRFHKERLENKQLRQELEEVCSDVFGITPIKVVCEITQRDTPLPVRPDPAPVPVNEPDILQAAKEVFS